MLKATFISALLLTTGFVFAQAQPNPDADFPFQGEYAGEITGADGKGKVGMQVIALSDGKFRAVMYIGGLPGDGWVKDKWKQQMEGQRDGEIVRFNGGDNSGGTIRNGKFTVEVAGKEVGSLPKVSRSSPTLGAKPPEGAIILFDGKNTDAWEKGKMTDDGLLMQGTQTKQKFFSGTLHVEFMLPYEPKGRDQGRGNSGVYLQGRDEVQVLDSFGLEGKNNECGAIYGIAAPIVNMCFPPMTWQTYDIEFTAAKWDNGKKVSNAIFNLVRHNGVVVHKDQEVTKVTTAAPVGDNPEPGPINIQDHGHQVRYRNIWFVPAK
jgi:hypothetical protein